MKKIIFAIVFGTSLSTVALAGGPATLFGISSVGTTDTFCSINTTTGAATAIFSYTNSGGSETYGLAYNPTNNRFMTIHIQAANLCNLIEIDPVALTATVVTPLVGSTFFEGVEYSSSLGGWVITYGANGFSPNLALLSNTHNALQTNIATGISDMDQLYVDGTGALNMQDTNDLFGGFERNRLNNPFTGLTESCVGPNIYAPMYDAGWKQDESKLFFTDVNTLSYINGTETGFVTVGNFGTQFRMTGIAAVNPVPEPTSMVALAAGLGILARKRRKIA